MQKKFRERRGRVEVPEVASGKQVTLDQIPKGGYYLNKKNTGDPSTLCYPNPFSSSVGTASWSP